VRLGYSNKGKIGCTEREAVDDFSRLRKMVGERVLWGVERQPVIMWLQCLPRHVFYSYAIRAISSDLNECQQAANHSYAIYSTMFFTTNNISPYLINYFFSSQALRVN